MSSPSSPPSEIDSLPDSAPSDDIDDTSSDQEESDAEKEWKESLQQLELILTMVLVPYAGKYFGRKCAYWGEWTLRVISSLRDEDARSGRGEGMGVVLGGDIAWADLRMSRLGEIHGVEISG